MSSQQESPLRSKMRQTVVRYRRAAILLAIFLIQIALLLYAGSQLVTFEERIYNFQQLLILAIVTPYAFALWFWRDSSRQAELRQTEQTFHQSEMFRLQEWLVDFSNPGLQIAALYRLRRYLNGTHGVSLMESALHALMYSLRQSRSDPIPDEDEPLAVEFRKLLYTEPELLVRVSRHELFKGMNLSGITFRKMNLVDVNFSDCVMTDANFEKTHFLRAQMNNSDFSRSRFDGCAFDEVIARNSNFDRVDFANATLDNVVIEPSNGYIRSSEKIQLGKECRIIGDLYYNLIEMAIGAEINGKLIHLPHNADWPVRS